MAVDYGSLPFLEALAFFRAKLNLPTRRWDDLLGAAHDRAFVVAGALQADLLEDLRNAVEKAMEQGTTYETFKKDFRKIVAERGWTGWTGEGTKAGEAWRARVIYDTNLFSSYSAGRYQQMKAVADTRPWWRYRHSPASLVPRKEHLAWDGVILKHDDPWWDAHTPPCGWGCKCYVETLADRDLKKQGLAVTDREKIPYPDSGVDKGWDYQPGASVAEELAQFAKNKAAKLAGADPEAKIAKSYIAQLLTEPLFAKFFNSDLGGEFPVAVLDESLRKAMDAQQPVVMLSRVTVDEHRKHPEIGAQDYTLAQRIVDEGELYKQEPGRLIALCRIDGKLYRAALKRTGDKEKNYWLTLFLTTDELADIQVRDKFKRIR